MSDTTAGGVDPRRLVAISYVIAAIVLGVFLERILGLAFNYARVTDVGLIGEDWTLSTAIGYAIAAVAAVLAWKNERARRVSLEVAGELKKVTWPSLRETRAATVAVVVATFVAAIILGFFDLVWARLSALIY
ncbi:MAG: preprotein translocase subunit SecE [Myxococcales bacterium]